MKLLRRLIPLFILLVLLYATEWYFDLDLLDERRLAAEAVEEVQDADLRATLREMLGREAPPPPSGTPGTVRLVTWNIRDLGGSKSDAEIDVMAEVLREADLVAVQEVVTSPKGAQAVARLDAALDRTGAAWDYRLSDPTSGDGSERYAFLWKPSRVEIVGRAWLEPSLRRALDREPFCARFRDRGTGRTLLVANLHAVPTSKDPAHEIAYLDRLHTGYEADHVVVVGDFNLDEDDGAFDELRRLGYRAALDDQPTSLRIKRRSGPNGHLANEYDNVFYEARPLRVTASGIFDFTGSFRTLKAARGISDHLPVYADVQWTGAATAQPAAAVGW